MHIAVFNGELRHLASHHGVEVVDLNLVLFHHRKGGFIVADIITKLAPSFAFWDWGGGGEDEGGSSFFEALNELFEVGGVFLDAVGYRSVYFVALPLDFRFRVAVAEVMQAPVEMDDVPFLITEPFVDVREPLASGTSVGPDAVHVGDSFEFGTSG